MSAPLHPAWHSRSVVVRGARLEAQAVGDPDDPALLLLGGATWSRDWWPDELCALLASAGLRVIRYDPRDTGGSTLSPPGAPDYTGLDLADDAVAVLDAFGIDRAFVLGLSMGAGLAQLIASRDRERVAGLVLLCSSPAFDVAETLPGPTPEILATFTDPAPEPDWADRDAVIDWVIASERPYAGPGHFDEPALRELAARIWDRTPTMASAANHFLVAEAGPPIDPEALSGIPALIVHGSADPLLPLPHGEALASALGARLLVLEGTGHQMPPQSEWPALVDAVRDLTGRGGTR